MKDIFITAPLLSLLSWKVLTCANTFDWHQMTSHHNLQRLASAICRIELKGRSHLHPENRTGDRTYPITNYPKMHISLRFQVSPAIPGKKVFRFGLDPMGNCWLLFAPPVPDNNFQLDGTYTHAQTSTYGSCSIWYLTHLEPKTQ